MAFSGWPDEALEFYEGLEADNSKAYWTSHKAVYQEQVLRPMEELLEELAAEFGEPKIFRPYRDIRFSAIRRPTRRTSARRSAGPATCSSPPTAVGAGPACGTWSRTS